MVSISETQSLFVADVGGTHARFLMARQAHSPHAVMPREYRLDLHAENFDSFEDLVATALEDFADEDRSNMHAVFAVAGPVHEGHAHFTNLPWTADAAALKTTFGFRSVSLLNDLAAAARGLAGQAAPEALILQAGQPNEDERKLLLSVGTGLGAAYWTGQNTSVRIDASEAGHIGFSPVDTWQFEWLRRLHLEYGRVSWERVLSGSGLAALDSYLRDGDTEAPADIAERARHNSATAQRAIRLFSGMLGQFAGDLALAAPAFGGVWLTGGVLRGLDRLFDSTSFMEGFHAKGRVSNVLDKVPVYWVNDAELGLRGAWIAASGKIQPAGRKRARKGASAPRASARE